MPLHRRGTRDLLVLTGIAGLLLALGTLTHLDDRLHAWLGAGRHPLDEVLFTLTLLSAGLAVFYLRRTWELRSLERSYRGLFETVTEAIYVQDVDGRFLDVNPAVLAMYGYTREELIGQTPAMLADPERVDMAATLDAVQRAFAGEPQRFEWWARRKNGELFAKEVTITRGTYFGRDVLIAVARETTEQKRLEEQLRLAQKMEAVGRLAGGIAHDFNNLLTAIGGTTEVVLDEMPASDPLRADLLEVRRATNRAAALTRQLLAFSRMQVLRPRLLNLNATVGEMMGMLKRLLGAEVSIATELGARLGCVRADASQIEQVVLNLAVNARDAMPRGGRLVIATRDVELDESWAKRYRYVQPGPYVMLSVSDTGTGMGAELREKIFEPFFTTKEAGKGTGLGLSTVYGIVKQSGGYVWVESEPGRGSTFRVYLPRVAGAPEPEEADAHRGARAVAASATILLVEDEESVRSLTRRVLQRHGYTVLEAPDGAAALELSAQHEGGIDLLLTDMRMPGLSGNELAERLCAQRPGTGVLYMSGYTEHRAEQMEGSERAGFLQKPFSATELLNSVQALLSAPEPSGA